MGRRPSVSIFLPSLAGGGAERSIVAVANGLAARGAEVTLVLGSARGPYVSEVGQQVRTVDLGSPTVPRSLPGLVRHLRANRPSALLSAMTHANVGAALAHRLSGCGARLVLSERVHLTSLFAVSNGHHSRATRALMRLTYPLADQIVAVSDGVATDLRNHIPSVQERILTIYNPVVTRELRAMADLDPAHPWLSSGTVPVILAAGRLIDQKDFATLITAFSLVRRQRLARLVILGEGELRAPLLQCAARLGIADDVSLPGFEPNPFAAMRAARVFVLSSRFEGLPGVLIQAMACGTRVVSTDCPSGPREVLENGRWGPLVPVGDARAMAAAITEALDNPLPPDVRSRAAEFTDEIAISRYADVLGLGTVGTADIVRHRVRGESPR